MALNEALKQGMMKGGDLGGWTRLRAPGCPWIVSLAVVIAYITFVTEDTYLGPIPFKLFLVALAIVAWWLQVGRQRTLHDYQFALPVLLFAIAIPVVWALVRRCASGRRRRPAFTS